MADNNKDNPQRDTNRPEDNPFIAFRRYADSQVSSLLNTVFTLPAQIANYNNAHHAREQCLFGKADPQKCKELQTLDAHTEKLRREGTESYRTGDVQAVLEKSEQLMMMEQQAGELRRAILSETEDSRCSAQQQRKLVETVGNRKGQEWSASWDWPEATRDEDQDDTDFGRWLESRARRAGGEIERMLMRLEEDASKVFGEEIEELRRHWAARYDGVGKAEDEQPRECSQSWLWQWPPPADASNQSSTKTSNDPYSPAALEADKRTRHMGSLWRNAFEDLMRTTQEHPLLSDTQNSHFDQMGLYSLRDYEKQLMQLEQDHKRKLLAERQELARNDTGDEPSYEYAHDHEDQHDDPPTPKPHQTEFPKSQLPFSESSSSVETELDAYERLLTPPKPLSSPPESQSKILSTLTTTERTTAPDGTITTKVVLKKRFVDGSGQSSETVHTQRGENIHQSEDSVKAMQQSPSLTSQGDQKKGGWFWSS
ncbi:hypothetical protein C7974DRAFT_122175 [Boeremia exigua]|uniref:uncharacterized protein n=1 Tax=Boeremia exigua TaxID=749465 RepID=UPI001E8E72BB|nr:uncharacterized protein C7974DRAFT_122175 [Boeremia exigua]KAH6638830.1 hypothetical protein C7974DRAFT_122175 [Boeremia exigua]